MGTMGKISGTLVFLGIIYIYMKLNRVLPVPTIEEKWWGTGEIQKEDISVNCFKIDVPDEEIRYLQVKLRNKLPFQSPLEGVNQNYGINTKLLETFVDYWRDEYNWTQRQEFLNKFPQFTTKIQGLSIHFIHVKPKNIPEGFQVLPLLLLHGWPESVSDFYEMISILTTDHKDFNFVFEIVVPSLPGYGFSDGAARPGLGPAQIAQVFNKLMIRLNLNRYYIQGGDWGSAIAQITSVLYPNNVIAVHRNWCYATIIFHPKILIGTIFPSLFFTQKEKERIYPLSEVVSFLISETGYLHQQATKPDTVGVALRDSPVGLAAYILEKFMVGTNPAGIDLPDGGLIRKFNIDRLLDNIMIYWVTRSMTTSMRIYAEYGTLTYLTEWFEYIPIQIPSGCNRFKNEFMFMPETILRELNTNLIHLTDYEDGGHYPAFEVPEVLAKDIFDFANKVQNLPKEHKEL